MEASDTAPENGSGLPDETISVIICSYTLERWDDLERAVASAQNQTLPPKEVIVVIDGDPELKRRADQRLGGASVLMNTHPPGLSGARQTGADHASGAILVFLDDDAIADGDWLEQLRAAYADPNVLGVGGLIDPLWREPAPRWFPAEFNWVVGCTYAGMPVKTTRIRNAIGANMSVWASVLASAGAFDSRLGRTDGRKGLYGTAEETEFGIRTTAAHPGRYWVYRPEARVRHVVSAERATWRYFIRRCRVEGRAKAVLAGVAGSADGLESERVYARSVLPRAVARGIGQALKGDSGGLARAGAIVTGLGVTTLAYASTRIAAIRPARHG
ncbi:MAG: glycosyltransferase family 2 protein [Solirubrobacteraceae bacterium]